MAAAHHVIGAAVAGARSMTATSGPGFSLMQEAISAGGITETPDRFSAVEVVGEDVGPEPGEGPVEGFRTLLEELNDRRIEADLQRPEHEQGIGRHKRRGDCIHRSGNV